MPRADTRLCECDHWDRARGARRFACGREEPRNCKKTQPFMGIFGSTLSNMISYIGAEFPRASQASLLDMEQRSSAVLSAAVLLDHNMTTRM